MNEKLPCAECVVLALCRGQFLNYFVNNLRNTSNKSYKGMKATKESAVNSSMILARAQLQKKCELLVDYIYRGYTINEENKKKFEIFFFEEIDVEELWNNCHV